MGVLGGYLLGVLGVVFLVVLVDLILPDGKINKYIKSILSIFVVAVIISPVASALNLGFDFDKIITGGTYEVDDNILNNITNQNIVYMQDNLAKSLDKAGYEGVSISIVTEGQGSEAKIKYIYVDLCDLVINKNLEHIDYYTKIKELIINLVDNLSEEQIILYG